MSTRTRQRTKWWTGKGIAVAVGVVAWLVADSVFHYRSILGLCVLACLGLVWFVAPGFESLVKRISLETVVEALAATDEESTTSATPSRLRKLRDELRAKLQRADFVPYSVTVRVNIKNFQGLLQKVGFFDGEQWINGVKWREARLGHGLGLGIEFVVLSSGPRGNPQLVYRTDGDRPAFQMGLDVLSRTIEEAYVENKVTLIGTTTWHPSLCFGELTRGSSGRDVYEIAIEVDKDWWDKISPKPEIECHTEYETTEFGPVASVCLVLARIPRRAIHGEDPETYWREQSLQGKTPYQTQLEELGWTPMEHAPGLVHRFVEVFREDLDGRSLVGKAFEWGSGESPDGRA